MFTVKKTHLFLLVSVVLWISNAHAADVSAPQEAAKAQAAGKNDELDAKWGKLDYGMYIHFAMGEFSKKKPAVKADVRQWLTVAKAMGMKYAVLVVKHEDGFCLWDSADYSYDIGRLDSRQDVVAEFMAACKQFDILPGIHYSLPDSLNDEGGKPEYKNPLSDTYYQLVLRQTSELHQKYTGIFFEKFDVENRLTEKQRQELRELIGRLNPGCMIMIQSGGDKLFSTQYPAAEQAKNVFVPEIKNYTIIQGWMWTQNGKLKKADMLYEAYQKCKEQHISFLLNVGPDMSGKIPAEQIAVLRELKKMMEQQPKEAKADKGDIKERLEKLKQLYKDGLITKEAYDQKQKEILDSM